MLPPPETTSNKILVFTYSRCARLPDLLVASIVFILWSVYAAIHNSSKQKVIFHVYNWLLVVIYCELARSTTFLVEWFPHFHYVSLVVEFAAEVMPAVYRLITTAFWYISHDVPPVQHLGAANYHQPGAAPDHVPPAFVSSARCGAVRAARREGGA